VGGVQPKVPYEYEECLTCQKAQDKDVLRLLINGATG